MKETVGEYHTIYGEWDDVVNTQFMIYHQTNAPLCIVFLFSGIDYGGGISAHFSANYEKINSLIERAGNDYQAKLVLENYYKDLIKP